MGIAKVCEVCGKQFLVYPSLYRIRTCSHQCGYKIRRIPREALVRAGEIGGSMLKGRKFPGRMNAGCFQKGHKPWNTGKQRIDISGKNALFYRLTEEERNQKAFQHSQKMKGRKNPQHSKYLKKFYLEHPEKHPNAIMAQKQKSGVGYISKGQVELYWEIRKSYPQAELNYPIKTSSSNLYFADICLPSLKLVIEYDGDYWHKDRAKDNIRDSNLQLDGWRVIRIKEGKIARKAKRDPHREQEIMCGEFIVKKTGLATS